MAVAVGVTARHVPELDGTSDALGPSFDELYARCRADLVALCHRKLGPTGDAEAVAQEAFLRAWSSRDSYAKGRPFWPWMATIARRLCIDQLRRRKLEQTRFGINLDLRFEHRSQPEEHVERSEEHRVALEAFRRLSPREQRLLGLREIDGWSIDRLATSEGMTADAVRSALKRSRATFRQAYAGVIGS